MSGRVRRSAAFVAPALRPTVVAKTVFTYAAFSRMARGQRRRGPLEVPAWVDGPGPADARDASSTADQARGAAAAPGPVGPVAAPPRITVVIPARDEAERISGVLGPLVDAPGVVEVLVVDDRSTDATAEVALAGGARVIDGGELPRGWIGKPWALQQGLVAAKGDIVVFLDADVQPDPRLPAAVAALLDDQIDLASAQLAFTIPDQAQRILHPALLATLVYRLGPLDSAMRVPASVRGINGQCFAVRREALISAGGFGLIAGIPTDDIALARSLAAAGWKIAVADGSHLGSVRMYESAGEALREWAGRSLALPGAAPRWRQLFDVGVVWTVQGLPGLRVWRGLIRGLLRGSVRDGLAVLRPHDLAMLALRWSLQFALTKVYRRADAAAGMGTAPEADGASEARPADGALAATTHADPLALLAPFTDPIAAAALTRGTFAPVRVWRGRAI